MKKRNFGTQWMNTLTRGVDKLALASGFPNATTPRSRGPSEDVLQDRGVSSSTSFGTARKLHPEPEFHFVQRCGHQARGARRDDRGG